MIDYGTIDRAEMDAFSDTDFELLAEKAEEGQDYATVDFSEVAMNPANIELSELAISDFGF